MQNINIKATHTTLTQSMQAYAAKKIKVIEKFLKEEHKLHLELEADLGHHKGPRYRAELTIMPHSEIFAEAYGNDLYEAIDLLVPQIKEQLQKKKDKRVSKLRR